MMDQSHHNVCPYSISSLHYFLLYPLVKILQTYLNLPSLFTWIFVCYTSPYIWSYFIQLFARTNHITLVEHSIDPDHRSNHPHSSAISTSVKIRSAILGFIFYLGFSLISSGHTVPLPYLVPIGIYITLLSFFHFSEYFVTSITNPSSLCLSSFLIDQSTAYVAAISSSFVEYAIEVYLFPEFKKFNLIALIGLILAIGGESIRKLAMFTAGKNFSHTISSEKDPNHHLVTHGIYGLLRHPSYTGWFYWAVGSQILLQNPICVVLFSVISYKFFKDRIAYEESILVEFFGNNYVNYRKKVGLGLPIWR